MDNVQERVDALLASPLGCAFLIMAAQTGLGPRELARPSVSHRIAAMANADLSIWSPGHERLVEHVLRRGPAHADLAHALLESAEADGWFAPCDMTEQVWAPVERGPVPMPGPGLIRARYAPVSDWEKYAQKPHSLWTSTRVGGSVSLLVGMEEGAGDLYLVQDPLPTWHLRARAPARVYEIDGPDAWHTLCVRYPATGNAERTTIWPKHGQLVPDWQAASADWDGVHLTFGGLLNAEQVRTDSAEGWTVHQFWDVELTVWLRWVFTDVQRLPDYERSAIPEWTRGIDRLWR